jgi:hypothetical protein
MNRSIIFYAPQGVDGGELAQKFASYLQKLSGEAPSLEGDIQPPFYDPGSGGYESWKLDKLNKFWFALFQGKAVLRCCHEQDIPTIQSLLTTYTKDVGHKIEFL